MGNLRRFCVIGSRDMNNYYIVYTYLKQYIPKDAIIITGGARGVDLLAEVYAEMNGQPCEVYEARWDQFGKSAGMIRNAEMIKNSDHLIAFWDGKSPGTQHMLQEWAKRGRKSVVVDVRPEDYITTHPGRVVHVRKEPYDIYIGRPYKELTGSFGTQFKIDANNDRNRVIAMFTDYLLKNPDMLRDLVQLKNQKSKIDDGPLKLACWCAPDLCHGDVLCWMLDNAYEDLCRLANIPITSNPIIKESNQIREKKPKQTLEEISSIWNVSGSRDVVSTSGGLPIANGYKGIVQDPWGNCYLEVSDLDVIKNHIHMKLSDYSKADDDVIYIDHLSNDRSKVKIRQILTEFEDDPFKTGYWYIKIDDQIQPVKNA